MSQNEISEVPPEVLSNILKALGVNSSNFIYNLLNDKPYEVMIYAEICKLYKIIKGNS